MPLVTSYRRYAAGAVLGAVAAPAGRLAVVAAAAAVAVPVLGGAALYGARSLRRERVTGDLAVGLPCSPIALIRCLSI